MKCISCQNDMILDDIDYNFKGNKDNYYVCEQCDIACFEKIRDNKSVFVHFYPAE